jgi:molybdopterin converting factor small subunit
MGFLERLENLIQGAVEGGTNSVLRQKLKPVEIENHLERAMRDNTQPSRGSKLAPNAYTVLLHPDTFRETIAGVQGYNRHCEMLLNQYAARQGYTLLQPRISVTFDTDAGLGRRDVTVHTGFEAPHGAGQAHHTPPGPSSSSTKTQVFASAPRVDSSWRIQVIHGRDVNQVFTIPEGETTIGRSPESGIVLRDEKNTVSRHHAAFIARGNELRVRDVGSKNGTKVNGNYVPDRLETLVTDGAEIAFGECVVRVRSGLGGERW